MGLDKFNSNGAGKGVSIQVRRKRKHVPNFCNPPARWGGPPIPNAFYHFLSKSIGNKGLRMDDSSSCYPSIKLQTQTAAAAGGGAAPGKVDMKEQCVEKTVEADKELDCWLGNSLVTVPRAALLMPNV
eukprot:1160702-Pelagomonas_calceolata.AAC.4